MRVLACGDRDWSGQSGVFAIWTVLDGVLYRDEASRETTYLIEGAARGADTIAAEWAMARLDTEWQHLRFPAQWDTHGKAAGPIRNQQMLNDGKPDVVFAFHDNLTASKGTADMCRRAHKAGVPVYVVSRYPTPQEP